MKLVIAGLFLFVSLALLPSFLGQNFTSSASAFNPAGTNFNIFGGSGDDENVWDEENENIQHLPPVDDFEIGQTAGGGWVLEEDPIYGKIWVKHFGYQSYVFVGELSYQDNSSSSVPEEEDPWIAAGYGSYCEWIADGNG